MKSLNVGNIKIKQLEWIDHPDGYGYYHAEYMGIKYSIEGTDDEYYVDGLLNRNTQSFSRRCDTCGEWTGQEFAGNTVHQIALLKKLKQMCQDDFDKRIRKAVYEN